MLLVFKKMKLKCSSFLGLLHVDLFKLLFQFWEILGDGVQDVRRHPVHVVVVILAVRRFNSAIEQSNLKLSNLMETNASFSLMQKLSFFNINCHIWFKGMSSELHLVL